MSRRPGVLLRRHCDVLQEGRRRVIMGRLNKSITVTDANCVVPADRGTPSCRTRKCLWKYPQHASKDSRSIDQSQFVNAHRRSTHGITAATSNDPSSFKLQFQDVCRYQSKQQPETTTTWHCSCVYILPLSSICIANLRSRYQNTCIASFSRTSPTVFECHSSLSHSHD